MLACGRWYHKAQNCADVAILGKLVSLASLPGVRTTDPREAHLFVVPFLGGFRARNTPWDTNQLNNEARRAHGRGALMSRLVGELAHFHHNGSSLMRRRHLFLLPIECTGCLAHPCTACLDWHRVNGKPQIELSLTLGPTSRRPARLRGSGGATDQAADHFNTQIVIPPNIMDRPFHPRFYVPLCVGQEAPRIPVAGSEYLTLPYHPSALVPSASALLARDNVSASAALLRRHDSAVAAATGSTGEARGDMLITYTYTLVDDEEPQRLLCRPNTAKRELLLFYQGAWAHNTFRGEVLDELRLVVFGRNGSKAPCAEPYFCDRAPWCCVNAAEKVAYFSVGSHWTPRLPLDWEQTAVWMGSSTFCLCPGGDTPYSKRFFMALLAGCVPVVFVFPSYPATPRRSLTNWWRAGGPANDDMLPFSNAINYSELVVEIPSAELGGFVERLRRIPHAVVEEKQRRIERVRHLLLFDPSGAGEDAFTMILRTLIEQLVPPR